MTPKLDYVPDPIWDIPSWIWETIDLGHGSSQIEIPIWDDRNRTSDLGYPKFDMARRKHRKVIQKLSFKYTKIVIQIYKSYHLNIQKLLSEYAKVII